MKAIWLSLSLVAACAGAAAAQTARPDAPATFAFEEIASLAPAQILGETPIGRRQSIPITGGTVSGPGFRQDPAGSGLPACPLGRRGGD